jgi:ribosome-binding factor A
MIGQRLRDIKRAKKESAFFRELSRFMLAIELDETRLRNLTLSKIALSSDGGTCTAFFYTPGGQEKFNELLEVLVLYKPSMRKALSQAIPSRYTPELIFKYDTQFEKQHRIEDILEKIKEEESLS